MKMLLKNREWKKFKLSSIFEIENCKCSKVSDLKNGNFPYVGATNRNNGVLKFVKPINSMITKGNCIAFICDGEGSVGYSIYKNESFIGSTTVKVGRNDKLNKYVGAFITTIADTVSSKYNFGFKRNEAHLKNEILILPTARKNEPDYAFMETYMRKKEQEKIKKYKNYISKRLKTLEQAVNTFSFNEKEWEEFFLNDIFSKIQRGKRLKKADHKKGKTPYVSSTAMNNGIDNYISNKENVRIFSNCLSLANSGSVGACFYQPYKFIASDHITKLENEEFNKYILLFLSTITTRLGEKYSFNREINDTRIRREKILLPINENKEPDYDFMENYIKRLELQKLKKYLDYKLKKK